MVVRRAVTAEEKAQILAQVQKLADTDYVGWAINVEIGDMTDENGEIPVKVNKTPLPFGRVSSKVTD